MQNPPNAECSTLRLISDRPSSVAAYCGGWTDFRLQIAGAARGHGGRRTAETHGPRNGDGERQEQGSRNCDHRLQDERGLGRLNRPHPGAARCHDLPQQKEQPAECGSRSFNRPHPGLLPTGPVVLRKAKVKAILTASR